MERRSFGKYTVQEFAEKSCFLHGHESYAMYRQAEVRGMCAALAETTLCFAKINLWNNYINDNKD